MFKRRIYLAMACVMLLSVLVGCSSKKGEDADDRSSEKKVLNFGVFNAIDTLEPTNDWDSWYIVRIGVGETLVRFSEDMSAEPWLADSWTVSEDQLSWTFKIHEGVEFSNGTQLTAEAVKNSIERVFQVLPERATTEFFEYESIEADDLTLVIKTKEPTPNLPGMLADPLFLIVDTTADTDKFADEGAVCTGPYMYIPRTGETITAVKNPNYWDGDAPLDEVNFVLIEDTSTRSMALQSGEIDIAANMATVDLPIFESDKGFSIKEIESLRLVMAYMNLEKVLSDEALRQAVICALDLESYCENLLDGRFTAGAGPLPPSIGYGFEDLDNPYAYDINKAKSVLEAAGYKDSDGDGYIEKDGSTVTLDYVFYSSREELPLLAEATQNSLKQIGIKVELEQVEYATMMDRKAAGDYDLCSINVITAGTGDPQTFLCGYFETGAANNNGGYSNGELDKLLNELKVEFDMDKRVELVEKAQQSLIDNPGYIFYAYPNTNIVHSTKVSGVKMLPADYYWVTKDIDIKAE